MKPLVILLIFIVSAMGSHAQLGNVLKRKSNEAVDKAADKVTDKVLDKVFANKKKKEGKSEDKKDPDQKKDDEQKHDNGSTTPAIKSNTSEQQEPLLKTYGKYDFVPGDKLLGYDDFDQDAIGDFPARWVTNASGEVMKVENQQGKWLNVSKGGFVVPEFITALPQNFTMEYDVLYIPPPERKGPNTPSMGFQICQLQNIKNAFDLWVPFARFQINPYLEGIDVVSYGKDNSAIIQNNIPIQGIDRNHILKYHVSVWRQKRRLRVYLNENKVCDLPSMLDPEVNYNSIRFVTELGNDGSTWLFTNFKYTVGAPDTRSKLLTEGKFSTTGILFDVNSAVIKPNSYGTLKEIAAVLAENPSIKVKIIGHTDSDGEAAFNLTLSKKRAEAVKSVLVTEFNITAENLATDGKGAAEPVSPNTTQEGKAQNRRVEFIKEVK